MIPTHKAAKMALRANIKSTLKALQKSEVERQSKKVSQVVCALPEFRNARSVSIYVPMPQGEIDTTEIIRTALDMKKDVFIPFVHPSSSTEVPYITSVLDSSQQKDDSVPLEEETPKKKKLPSVMDMLQLHCHEDFDSLIPDRWGIPSFDPKSINSRPNCFGGFGIKTIKSNGNTECDRSRADQRAGLELMIMPGVAFDRNLNRMGHGMGYYDRFLDRFRNKEHKKPILVGVGLKEQLLPEGEEIPIDFWDECLDFLVVGDGSVLKRPDQRNE